MLVSTECPRRSRGAAAARLRSLSDGIDGIVRAPSFSELRRRIREHRGDAADATRIVGGCAYYLSRARNFRVPSDARIGESANAAGRRATVADVA